MILEEQPSEMVIGCAIEVHRMLGPGLLESAYRRCLQYELKLRGIPFRSEVELPVIYKGMRLDCGYRMDLVIDDKIVMELKAVESLTKLHEAQLMTYLRLNGIKVGLLMNFNSPILRNAMVRRVL